jgi:hypothetical protein
MGARERILQFVEYKRISKSRFYKETGLSNGFLDKNNNPCVDKVEQIIYIYPELNPEWLITGKGSMLRQPQEPVRERVGEEKSSVAQEVTSKNYYELLEQHVALQAKYAALLEERQKNKNE